jgi:hypothetical protein
MSAAKRHRSLPGARAESERHHGFRAVGLTVSKLAAPIVARRGGGCLVRLKADWAAIVGQEWALVAWPAALGRDGVLKLRTVPTAAIELQHRAPLLIERINLYFGRPAVARLVLVQGLLPHAMALSGIAPRLPPPDEAKTLDRRFEGIVDPDLRAALARLGKAVLGARR